MPRPPAHDEEVLAVRSLNGGGDLWTDRETHGVGRDLDTPLLHRKAVLG